jgi:hypothetical protein
MCRRTTTQFVSAPMSARRCCWPWRPHLALWRRAWPWGCGEATDDDSDRHDSLREDHELPHETDDEGDHVMDEVVELLDNTVLQATADSVSRTCLHLAGYLR